MWQFVRAILCQADLRFPFCEPLISCLHDGMNLMVLHNLPGHQLTCMDAVHKYLLLSFVNQNAGFMPDRKVVPNSMEPTSTMLRVSCIDKLLTSTSLCQKCRA